MADHMEAMNKQLVEAVDKDDIERAKHLLEEGASVNVQNEYVCVLIGECVRDIEMSFVLNLKINRLRLS